MKPLRLLGWPIVAVALVALPACSGGGSSGGGTKHGNYTVHGPYYDDAQRAKAKANASDVLTKLQGEDNVCMVGLWAYNPPAILNAVRAANMLGKVKIVGFDEDEETLQGIKEGHIHATVVQQPFEFGYQSVRAMAALARDPNAKLPDEVKDGIWHIDHIVIKKDNVEEFHKKLRGWKDEGKSSPPTGGGRAKVAFVSNNPEEFWSIAQAGTMKAARDFKVDVLFRRPPQGTAAAQKEIVEDLLAQGVKAIAISVVDPENQKDYLNQIAERVPLLTVDNDAPSTKRRCYIGTNNVAAGKEVGKLVKEVMPGGGQVAIFVGQPDPINARERSQGVLDALDGK